MVASSTNNQLQLPTQYKQKIIKMVNNLVVPKYLLMMC